MMNIEQVPDPAILLELHINLVDPLHSAILKSYSIEYTFTSALQQNSVPPTLKRSLGTETETFQQLL